MKNEILEEIFYQNGSLSLHELIKRKIHIKDIKTIIMQINSKISGNYDKLSQAKSIIMQLSKTTNIQMKTHPNETLA